MRADTVITRRAAVTLLAGAAAACGGGGDPPTKATAPAASATPSAAVQTGALDRSGLVPTFAEDFSALNQDFAQNLPLNGKWQTWLNNGGRDNFYSRTLHQKTGEEQQYYLDRYIIEKHLGAAGKIYDPFALVDGPEGKVLRISARRMDPGAVAALADKLGQAQGLTAYEATKYWSSGCLSTYEGFRQRYGVFEARVKLSPQAGSWPAFWMLASDRGYSVWPPEIDIFDNYPQHDAKDRWVSGGVITTSVGFGPKDAGADGRKMGYDVRGQWRTIGLEWDEKFLTYYSDDVEFYRTPTPSNFHENMFVMLNLAVVGRDNGWADRPLDATQAIDLDIDWVRAWKRA